MKFFALLLALSSTSAWALDTFKKAPPLSQVTWIKGAKPISFSDSVQAPIQIVYIWATWCGPCVTVSKELAEIVKKYPGKFEVAAISEEDPKLVAEHLGKKYPDGVIPFSYGVVPKTEKPYLYISAYRPYFYFVQKGELIWQGIANPMERVQKLAASLMDGTWKKADHVAAQGKIDALQKDIKERKIKSAAQIKILADGLRADIEAYNKLMDLDPETAKISFSIRAMTIIKLHEFRSQQMDGQEEAKALVKTFEEQFRKQAEAVGQDRAELSMLANFLWYMEEKKDFYLPGFAAELSEKALALPADPSAKHQYLIYSSAAQAKAYRGHYSEAKQLLEQSEAEYKKEQTKSFPYSALKDEYEKKTKSECFSFLSCLKSAFRGGK